MSVRSAALLAALPLAACAATPPRVALEASPADRETLAGDWTGEYSSADTGRSGSILFSLVANEDHAHGDVIMIARGATAAYEPWREPFVGHAPLDPSQVLTIHFVAAEGGEVWGVLDPYRDPDCDCPALTRFRGRLRGDTIAGTFTTHTAAGIAPSSGRFQMSRTSAWAR